MNEPEYLKFRPDENVWGQNMLDIVNALKSELKPSDIFVDCGSHVGFICVPVLKEIKPRQTFLFEPNPYLAETLLENLRLNDISDYKFIDKPVWNSQEEVEFLVSGAQSSILNRGQGIDKKLTLQTTTLDEELIGTEGDIVLKMDIECAEPQAFEGFREGVHRVRFAIVEIMAGALTRDFGVNLEGLLNELKGYGFSLSDLSGNELSIQRILNQLKVDVVLRRI